MWTFAAPTSQNPSARGVGETYGCVHAFWNAESRRKRGKIAAFLFAKFSAPFRGQLSSLIYSIRSEGWQSSTSHILSRASIGKCFAELLQIAEIVGGRMPVFSANSFCVISRMASITLTLNFIIINSFSDLLPFAHYNTLFVVCQYEKRKIITIFSKKLRKTYWQITNFVL